MPSNQSIFKKFNGLGHQASFPDVLFWYLQGITVVFGAKNPKTGNAKAGSDNEIGRLFDSTTQSGIPRPIT